MSKLLLLALSVGLVANAQQFAAPQIAGANLPAQKIGPNDLIAVSVYDAPEFTRTIRVSDDGMIRLPMVQRRVDAKGLLPSELETSIGEVLQAEQILVDPVVTVTIVEYHSRPISVAGAVYRPVTFQAETAVSLLDALTKAEGLRPEAGPEILISRAQPGPNGDPVTLIQRVPAKELLSGTDPEWNVMLQGGEEIRVPEAGKVFIVGNVKKPGAFLVDDTSGTSVLKVLALSEGLMPFASKLAYVYRKEVGSGTKNEIEIPLRDIMERRAADVTLQENDIFYVPDNRSRRAKITALEKIIGFGTATASGVLIWGVAR